eukprot:g8047.t1
MDEQQEAFATFRIVLDQQLSILRRNLLDEQRRCFRLEVPVSRRSSLNSTFSALKDGFRTEIFLASQKDIKHILRFFAHVW